MVLASSKQDPDLIPSDPAAKDWGPEPFPEQSQSYLATIKIYYSIFSS